MRHAYLIMAHGNYKQLQLLVNLLDHSDNDFYIHIDKKKSDPLPAIKARYSYVDVFSTVPVYWGTYSMVECTFRLLERATTQSSHDYYHLLSGQDLPIRSNEEIIYFFERNKGKEFISFSPEAMDGNSEISRRAKLYHFLTKQRICHRSYLLNQLFVFLDRLILMLQIVMRINRNKRSNYKISYGSNWFSITEKLSKAFLNDEDRIKKRFKLTNNCDELVLQSFIKTHSFEKHCYGHAPHFNNLRFINWGGMA